MNLTWWIFLGLAAGLAFGLAFPASAPPLGVLGDIFLRLITSILAPLMFATLVVGVARAGGGKTMGRIGLKALIVFQVLTTLALAIGAAAALFARPGADVSTVGAAAAAIPQASVPLSEFFTRPFPASIIDAMARGDVLQIVVFALLFGFACSGLGAAAEPVVRVCESLAAVMFRYTHYVMYLAPAGIFGAVAASVAARGPNVLFGLLSLIATLYAALAVFVLLVLAPLAALIRLPLRRFLALVREPFMIAFSTTSSNVALPVALENMERLGVPRHVAALVLPASMSFNTTGSCLFLSLAAVFCAQASGVALPAASVVLIVLTLMLTTKGIGAVPRGSLVILAGTLSTFGLPLEGVALILGVDQLMDMARTGVNMLGHCLSAAAVARWEGVGFSNHAEPRAALTPQS